VVSLFRNNQVTTAVPLAIYVLLTHLAALLGMVSNATQQIGQEGLLYTQFFGWFSTHPSFSALAATVLVFIQALLVNNLADEFRLLGDRNWLPGLFFALMAASIPDFLFLSAPLVAATFLPIAMRRIFRVYKTPSATSMIFDSAFWMTVGALFYPPAIWMLVAAYVGILVMRSFNIREQIVFLSGILIPMALCWLGFFWYDLGHSFFDLQFGKVFGLYRFHREYSLLAWLEIGFLMLIFFLILLSFNSYFSRKLIQTQKCISTLYWFLIIAVFTVFMQAELPNQHFFLAIPAIGIFLSLTVTSIKRRAIAEIVHLGLLVFVLFVQFFPG
jgi:hypothetical protein